MGLIIFFSILVLLTIPAALIYRGFMFLRTAEWPAVNPVTVFGIDETARVPGWPGVAVAMNWIAVQPIEFHAIGLLCLIGWLASKE